MHVTATFAVNKYIFIIIISSSSNSNSVSSSRRMKCNNCGAPLCFDFAVASRATTIYVICATEVVYLKKDNSGWFIVASWFDPTSHRNTDFSEYPKDLTTGK